MSMSETLTLYGKFSKFKNVSNTAFKYFFFPLLFDTWNKLFLEVAQNRMLQLKQAEVPNDPLKETYSYVALNTS